MTVESAMTSERSHNVRECQNMRAPVEHALSALIESEEFTMLMDRMPAAIRQRVDDALCDMAATGIAGEDAMEIAGNGWLMWSVPSPGAIMLLWVE